MSDSQTVRWMEIILKHTAEKHMTYILSRVVYAQVVLNKVNTQHHPTTISPSCATNSNALIEQQN